MRRVLMVTGPMALLVSLAIPGSAAHRPSPADPTPPAGAVVSSCAAMCPMIYEPVICLLSDGVMRTFSNDCVARSYACDHDLEIIGCVPRAAAAAAG